METTRLYSLPFSNVRTYLFALLFVAGNIALPQLCHLIPSGGPAFLPIYFFTLIAAYKYGLRVGLLTALLSPAANHLLFGMPALAVLPAILVKSGLLAAAAIGFVSLNREPAGPGNEGTPVIAQETEAPKPAHRPGEK